MAEESRETVARRILADHAAHPDRPTGGLIETMENLFAGQVPGWAREALAEDVMRKARGKNLVAAIDRIYHGNVPRKFLDRINRDPALRAASIEDASRELDRVIGKHYRGKIPSANPVQLESRTVNHVLEGNVLVSPKFDGVRYSLFACRKGVIAVDRAGRRFPVRDFLPDLGRDARPPRSAFLLDAEFFQGRFHVFDAIMVDGEDVSRKPFKRRIRGAARKLAYPLVVAKEFRELGDFPRNAEYVNTGELDGMIFSSPYYPYHDGVGYGHFKWKPRGELTVDLEVRARGAMPLLKGGHVWDRLVSWPAGAPTGVNEYRVVAVDQKVKLIFVRRRTKNPNAFMTAESVFRSFHDHFSFGEIVRTCHLVQDFRAERRPERPEHKMVLREYAFNLAMMFLPPPRVNLGRVFGDPVEDTMPLRRNRRDKRYRTNMGESIDLAIRRGNAERLMYTIVSAMLNARGTKTTFRIFTQNSGNSPRGYLDSKRKYTDYTLTGDNRGVHNLYGGDSLEFDGTEFVVRLKGKPEIRTTVEQIIDSVERFADDLEEIRKQEWRQRIQEESEIIIRKDEQFPVDEEGERYKALSRERKVALAVTKVVKAIEDSLDETVTKMIVDDIVLSRTYSFREVSRKVKVTKPKGSSVDMYLVFMMVSNKARKLVGAPEVDLNTIYRKKIVHASGDVSTAVEIVPGSATGFSAVDIEDVYVAPAPHQRPVKESAVLKATGNKPTKVGGHKRLIQSKVQAKARMGYMSDLMDMDVVAATVTFYYHSDKLPISEPDSATEVLTYLYRGLTRNVDLQLEVHKDIESGTRKFFIDLILTKNDADVNAGLMSLYRLMFL